ncbi:hypothetical protein GGS23DRAFT_586903 [Durotheca rogersii]|uniref:uncharacterized protein n=1 Tax=Durotheca rogersii TaxID=419775 RepID=UPI0022207CE9|nr:uncharacterized protein GGS23DRAFT_586903 [Durotheca rogersii]KAI5858172.1 hypothetical protein GGS23DRAFT_586903 [Durotheca rogersii]
MRQDSVEFGLSETANGTWSGATDAGGSSSGSNIAGAHLWLVDAEETIRTPVDGDGGRVDDATAYGPEPDPKGKGKAPLLASRENSDEPDRNAANVSTTKPHSWVPTTAASRAGPTEPLQNEGREGVQRSCPAAGAESDGDNCGATAQGSSRISSQRQKQKEESDPTRGSAKERAESPASQPDSSEAAEPPPFRPLQYGDPGWERSADRPPKKLPIRFKDAVGRQFVFPWEKVKTWEGMELLIRSCFAHVAVIGPHVNEGHYDLLTYFRFSANSGFGISPQGVPPPTNSQHPSSQEAISTVAMPSAPAAPAEAEEAMGGQGDGMLSEPAVPTAPIPLPASGSPIQTQQSPIVILPELWEDLIEPGMTIWMQMWPPSAHDPLPPIAPPPAVQPPISGPPHPSTRGFFRGRGRGRGYGRGRGVGPLPPVPPLGWTIGEASKPRGKTRKRQDGL